MGLAVRLVTSVGLLVCLLLGAALPARAQITNATSSTTGATCQTTGIAFGACRNSVAFTNSTSLTSRYAWNLSTDTDAIHLPTARTGTAQHNISFDVTAPVGYPWRRDVAHESVSDARGRGTPAWTWGEG